MNDYIAMLIAFVIGVLLTVIIYILATPYAGTMYIDKKAMQAHVGMSEIDMDKLKNGGSIRLHIREIDISKHSQEKHIL